MSRASSMLAKNPRVLSRSGVVGAVGTTSRSDTTAADRSSTESLPGASMITMSYVLAKSSRVFFSRPVLRTTGIVS